MRILATCFALLIVATPLSAQVNGRLSGTVVDANGNPVPAAKISLALQDSSTAALATTSTEAGIFSLTGVRPESYNVTVEAQGFQPYAQRDVAVYAAQET